MSMDLFFPDVGQVYHNRNGCDYECTAVYPGGRAAMRRIKDGWTLVWLWASGKTETAPSNGTIPWAAAGQNH